MRISCAQQPLVPKTSLRVLFYAFVHVADVVFHGVFVSITSRLFSVVAGVQLMAIVCGSLFGSTVLQVPVASYQLVLYGSTLEQSRGLFLLPLLFSVSPSRFAPITHGVHSFVGTGANSLYVLFPILSKNVLNS